MPAKSRKQQQMIYAKRSQYGSRDKAPEDWKWVFDSDWSKVEEEKLVPYKRLFENRKLKTITIICSDVDDKLTSLLNYIKDIGNVGHSFSIIVDPDSDDTKNFGWDGDGSDYIEKIEVE